MNWEDEQDMRVWEVTKPGLTKLLTRVGRRFGAPVVPEALFLAQMDTLRRTSAERTELKQEARHLRKALEAACQEPKAQHPIVAERVVTVPKTNETCPGCGVSVGQSCWDNCSRHPPFSQPVFLGGGAYDYGDRRRF
jgi:hypothetical protein